MAAAPLSAESPGFADGISAQVAIPRTADEIGAQPSARDAAQGIKTVEKTDAEQGGAERSDLAAARLAAGTAYAAHADETRGVADATRTVTADVTRTTAADATRTAAVDATRTATADAARTAIDAEQDAAVEFDRVLAVFDADKVRLGDPLVSGVSVTGRVIKQGKQKKVIVYKMKPKKNYRRKQGHRQPYTKVRIENIAADKF